MKKRFVLGITIMMILSLFLPVNAMSKEISLQLDGEIVEFDVSPILQKNRTLVPMRAVFEKMGAKVTWDEENLTVWIEDNYTIIELHVNEPLALIHRKYDMTGVPEEVILDVPTLIYNGRAFAPLRFISETLQAKVDWNSDHQTVSIITKKDHDKPALVFDNPIPFTVVDFNEIEISEELSAWYHTNEEETNYSYKIINGITYLKASAGMKPTGGFSVDIKGLYDLGNGQIFLQTSLTEPDPDAMVTQAITYPKALIKVEGISFKEVTGSLK